jgi:hypothetical protein
MVQRCCTFLAQNGDGQVSDADTNNQRSVSDQKSSLRSVNLQHSITSMPHLSESPVLMCPLL